MSLARKHNLAVVEDAAHAHGVEHQGQTFAGTFGDLGCFSFQESKNLPTGEGGMILTDSDEMYERAFSMHHLGRLPGELWYKHFHQAWNCRMNEFTAAIGIVQLGRMFDQNSLRMRNHAYLMSRLSQLPGIKPCRDLPGLTKHSHHLQMLRYHEDEVGGVSRNDFVKALIAEGIPALTGYTFPNYGNPFMSSDETRARYRAAGIDLPDYRTYSEKCPNTERACYKEAIWLEHRLLLGTQQDMDDIVGGFSKIIHAFRG